MTTILHVLFEERIGGPQLYVLQIARQLKKRGFDLVVAIPKGDPAFASVLVGEGIPTYELELVRLRRSLNPRKHIDFLAKFRANVNGLREVIHDLSVEIVHTHGLMNLQAAIAASQECVPLVWHIHEILRPSVFRTVFVPPIRRCSNAIAVVSDAVRRTYFRDQAGLRQRVYVLYAPVDTEKFCPEVDGGKVRKEFRISADAPVIGTVANVCPGKGQEYFLQAAREIKRRYPKAKFLVVGGKLTNHDRFWSKLRKQTAELGLNGDVFFTGRRSDIPQVLRAMTVFVQGSESEACPTAMLEAMASGVPVVATNVGGTPELLADGVTGILIEPKNAAHMTEAVTAVLDAPEQARRMGWAGVERVRDHFSLDRCVHEHERLYAGLLERTEHSARRLASLEAEKLTDDQNTAKPTIGPMNRVADNGLWSRTMSNEG